ncbi:MAG: hypothetical protein OEU50_20885 [Gammaproteobacteria bacterium]|nr:hypothetical protein [Gammaproteobacteria bacterium]
MAIRQVIAHDHAILRAGLKGLPQASRNVEVIAEADDGRQTVTPART